MLGRISRERWNGWDEGCFGKDKEGGQRTLYKEWQYKDATGRVRNRMKDTLGIGRNGDEGCCGKGKEWR